jgi:hypothetical protein
MHDFPKYMVVCFVAEEHTVCLLSEYRCMMFLGDQPILLEILVSVRFAPGTTQVPESAVTRVQNSIPNSPDSKRIKIEMEIEFTP